MECTRLGRRCVANLSILLAILLSLVVAEQGAFSQFSDTHDRIIRSTLLKNRQHHHTRQGATVAITGLQNGNGADGSVPYRVEIRDLQQNADQWNLYLLALYMMQQSTAQTYELSYYQIAGIHGRPFIPWDGVAASSGDQNNGYCAHSMALFTTWHRPYLALFEQTLYDVMQDVVNMFPVGSTRDRYASAAASFRIPYWDWAATPPAGESILPASLMAENVTVNTPNGTGMIPNPLFSYQFHPLSATDLPDPPYSVWPTTLRYPTSSSDPNAQSQNGLLAQALDNIRLSQRDRVYIQLTTATNYTQFSNEGWTQGLPPGNYDSLESIHDVIHNTVGGPNDGHMSLIPYSAFDPIFWLHHCNIDRLFAIWQVLNPDEFITPVVSPSNTFTISAGTIVDINTPLTPFHSDTSGTLWTSGGVRSTSTFGYTYPSLDFWNESGSTYQSSVKQMVNDLYGGTAPSTTTARRRSPLQNRESATDPTSQNTPQNVTSPEGTYREWITNIRVPKFALGASFTLYIFDGDFIQDPTQWALDANLVGTYSVFAISPNCENCAEIPSLQISGTVPLTTSLLVDIATKNLTSLEPADVEPWLKDNLHWRVVKAGGTSIDSGDVPGLYVSVVSAEVTHPSAPDEFPQWGPFTIHYNVTDSRPGGFPTGGEY